MLINHVLNNKKDPLPQLQAVTEHLAEEPITHTEAQASTLPNIFQLASRQYDESLSTALVDAAAENNLAKVKELLAKNANPDASKTLYSKYYSMSQQRYVDFHFPGPPAAAHAVWNNNGEMLKVLLAAGAKEAQNYFTDALEKEDLEMAHLLHDPELDMSNKIAGLVIAGSITSVRRLIDEFGADPNTVDRFGFPLFHIAVKGDYVAMAKMLIEKGANPHALTGNGIGIREQVNGNHNEEMFALLDSLNVK